MKRSDAVFCLLISALICGSTVALIYPAVPFDAMADATILRKAMKGWGTDEDAITDILTRRSREQRGYIAEAFNILYKRNLYDDLDSELSGDYWQLIKALITPLPQYYAEVLEKAANTADSEAIVDILITSTNAELNDINQAYKILKGDPTKEIYNILMKKNQLLSHNMIRSAFMGVRNEYQEINIPNAIETAQFIHLVGEEKTSYLRTWTEEKQVENIFITFSYPQLRQVFKEYDNLYSHSITYAFSHMGFHSDVEHGILNMISAIQSTPKYYAERLRQSMNGLGTNEDMLIRIVTGRSEKDLDTIREVFDLYNEDSLAKWITDDTSGDFRRALLAIVNS